MSAEKDISCQWLGSLLIQSRVDILYVLLEIRSGNSCQESQRSLVNRCGDQMPLLYWLDDRSALSPAIRMWDEKSAGKPWPSVGCCATEGIITITVYYWILLTIIIIIIIINIIIVII